MSRRSPLGEALRKLRRRSIWVIWPADELAQVAALVDMAHLPAENHEIASRAPPFTMTGAPRVKPLIEAVRYCVPREVPGALAECGVWRGGSILAMILTLQELGVDDRDIYLYDTFEGMPEPGEYDTSPHVEPARQAWSAAQDAGVRVYDDIFAPEAFDEERIRELVLATGYPEERIRFVRGRVEETLPNLCPDQLALLRLDTDWYESTRSELEHLYPVLSSGGVLIVDDYGYWERCKRAVDEYFEKEAPLPLLVRIDHTGRIAVKV